MESSTSELDKEEVALLATCFLFGDDESLEVYFYSDF